MHKFAAFWFAHSLPYVGIPTLHAIFCVGFATVCIWFSSWVQGPCDILLAYWALTNWCVCEISVLWFALRLHTPRLSLPAATLEGQRASTWLTGWCSTAFHCCHSLGARQHSTLHVWRADSCCSSMNPPSCSSRDASFVSSRDLRQPPQNRGNRHKIDQWLWLLLIQQLSVIIASDFF